MISGASNLVKLDLSVNYLKEFPTDALRHLDVLTYLNVSNNFIEVS